MHAPIQVLLENGPQVSGVCALQQKDSLKIIKTFKIEADANIVIRNLPIPDSNLIVYSRGHNLNVSFVHASYVSVSTWRNPFLDKPHMAYHPQQLQLMPSGSLKYIRSSMLS